MFGKATLPGWDESDHREQGSLQPSFPYPDEPEPGRYYPLSPTTEKTIKNITCPPNHYLGPENQCLPYEPTFQPEPKKPFPIWLVILGAFLVSQ